MSSIALDEQVGYTEFAEKFYTMWSVFQDVISKEKVVNAVPDNRGEQKNSGIRQN